MWSAIKQLLNQVHLIKGSQGRSESLDTAAILFWSSSSSWQFNLNGNRGLDRLYKRLNIHITDKRLSVKNKDHRLRIVLRTEDQLQRGQMRRSLQTLEVHYLNLPMPSLSLGSSQLSFNQFINSPNHSHSRRIFWNKTQFQTRNVSHVDPRKRTICLLGAGVGLTGSR